MGGAGFPPCSLFGLRRHNTGALQGCLVELMVGSGRAHAKEYFPELLLPVSLSSQWGTATPCLCRRPSNTSRLVWFSLLWGHCSFPWVPMHTLLCVCPPRVESLFPPVLSKSCIKSRLPSKSDSLGIPPPIAGPPGWAAWRGAQNLHSNGWTSVL